MKRTFPGVGMRNFKTAVAVVVSFLIFLPFWGDYSGNTEFVFTQIGPFYACIAAVICMQSSVEQSLQSGVSRLIGTLIGGAVGLLVLTADSIADNALLLALFLGLGIMLTIWTCNLIRRPGACAIACVVCCCIMLSHAGEERYVFALSRIGETAVGIVVAVVVNHIFPNNSNRDSDSDFGRETARKEKDEESGCENG